MQIIFATHNTHKLEEVSQMLPPTLELISLAQLGFHEEIPETATTLEGNATIKSQTIYRRYQQPCFADDTGLEVEALGGRPGVHSARYAGPSQSFEANLRKLLREMEGHTNRKARFRTVISLFYDDKTYLFEGIINGIITPERAGTSGFGYDPVFLPDGYDQTFAEMDAATKNRISHRGLAFEKLRHFLEETL
ncbi:MAG: non-canonical purine NTP pyrophosphatase [Bacteroidetes bacterium]|nr:MAG: non-canonical purine NTP pyrophosphatase [Bacteroidota bacterium]